MYRLVCAVREKCEDNGVRRWEEATEENAYNLAFGLLQMSLISPKK